MCDWIEIKEGCEMPSGKFVWVRLAPKFKRPIISRAAWSERGEYWYNYPNCKRFVRVITHWMPIESEIYPNAPTHDPQTP